MIPKQIGHVIKFPKTWAGLFQKACWEIPEVVGATGFALIGIGLASIGMYNYSKNDGDRRTYKNIYVIVRPDDPRAKLIKDPVETAFNTPTDRWPQVKGSAKTE
ncbi:uncharacterized protein LOC113233426 [Hyposmocoma kahamanoa]|uniref:uncharacterized protein LOC113233426 n=1 Tax=Hyposmocoma kahamanoa TaxID=1477025 RepID=UPI000E6D8741|nr:uncharacterized protein LOC113233426 [Hyposmocoma kahamanoa]